LKTLVKKDIIFNTFLYAKFAANVLSRIVCAVKKIAVIYVKKIFKFIKLVIKIYVSLLVMYQIVSAVKQLIFVKNAKMDIT